MLTLTSPTDTSSPEPERGATTEEVPMAGDEDGTDVYFPSAEEAAAPPPPPVEAEEEEKRKDRQQQLDELRSDPNPDYDERDSMEEVRKE